jgi:CheY-like chemotaxis protein
LLKRIIGEDITLETHHAPSLSTVRADAGQMEQVVVNLAVNARDAMPGGGRLVIETSEVEIDEDYCRHQPDAKPGAYVTLAVSDTGPGLTDEARAHVFEPFFTTKPSGTGLGLAMVYGAVRQNGGFVSFYSEVGHGTTFRVCLPAVGATEDAIPARTPAESPGGDETILLVEDDPLVRELACRVLEQLGYHVLAHGDGEAALQAAGQYDGRIHALVTDVVMPRMNGAQLSARLVATRPDVRTLFASGYTDNTIVQHGLVEPGVHFIAKPYTPQALAAKGREVLDA